jgi:hypothetical protein
MSFIGLTILALCQEPPRHPLTGTPLCGGNIVLHYAHVREIATFLEMTADEVAEYATRLGVWII